MTGTLHGKNSITNEDVTFNLSGAGSAAATYFLVPPGSLPIPPFGGPPPASPVYQLGRISYEFTAVPEPATWVLLGSGLLAFGWN